MTNVIKIETGLDLETTWLSEEIAIRDEFSTVIINASLDGIVAYDKQCRYTLWSPSMEKMTGLKSHEVLGRRSLELFPFLKEAGIDELYEKSLRGEVSRSSVIRYSIPRTGLQGFSEQRNYPLYNEMGEITGGMAIIRDVTNTQKILEELSRSNEELQTRIRELEALLAAMPSFRS
jgi:PAS domain S-box-containing protein